MKTRQEPLILDSQVPGGSTTYLHRPERSGTIGSAIKNAHPYRRKTDQCATGARDDTKMQNQRNQLVGQQSQQNQLIGPQNQQNQCPAGNRHAALRSNLIYYARSSVARIFPHALTARSARPSDPRPPSCFSPPPPHNIFLFLPFPPPLWTQAQAWRLL